MDVIQSLGETVRNNRDAVLATVIKVEGNAYRRPGAKMLVTPDGTGVGSITAGCLEDEVTQLGQDVLNEGRPRVKTYDLMEDDDVWGLGVGCNGIIDVLLEPVDDTFQSVIDAFDDGTDIASLTVLESEHDDIRSFTRGYYTRTDGLFSTDDEFPEWIVDRINGFVSELLKRGRGGTITVTKDDQTIELFADGIATPPELVVLGTGHDVGPVVELAAKNDFRVTVIGFRGTDATMDRFPDAADVRSTSPATLREAGNFDENTYAVVMTHNFVDDRLAIEELLRTPVSYIGLMGPRDRFEEMLKKFDADDPELDGELDRVYTPIGLNLGGGTPYQIAHSIVAELLAVHNERTPCHLKNRENPIHRRVASGK